MSWYFDPERAAQAAAFLVKATGGTRMQYLKLLKLLYFSDRVSLAEQGFPITGDRAYAMKLGPVLSTIYNFINQDAMVDHSVWDRYFRTSGYEVELLADPGSGKLSRLEEALLRQVHEDHGNLDGFDLSAMSHMFPEWQSANEARLRSNRGSEPIGVMETLRSLQLSEAQIAQIQYDAADERAFFEFAEELNSGASCPAG